MRNTDFWNNEGAQKVFTHPICSEWMSCLDRKASILDLGCGYGRLTPHLKNAGFSNIFGYDPCSPFVERAIRDNPGASYTTRAETLSGKFYDLILCFALFTSCPSSEEQNELITLINGLTRENAYLYISDYETHDNPHYKERYEQRKLGTYGCFVSGPAVFRHHKQSHFDRLFPEWEKLKERKLASKTLNGNDIVVHQYLYMRKLCRTR